MKSNKLALFISVFLILLAAGWFYWFQWRPASIRSKCYKYVTNYELSDKNMSFEQGQKLQALIENQYSNCLHEYGIEN